MEHFSNVNEFVARPVASHSFLLTFNLLTVGWSVHKIVEMRTFCRKMKYPKDVLPQALSNYPLTSNILWLKCHSRGGCTCINNRTVWLYDLDMVTPLLFKTHNIPIANYRFPKPEHLHQLNGSNLFSTTQIHFQIAIHTLEIESIVLNGLTHNIYLAKYSVNIYRMVIMVNWLPEIFLHSNFQFHNSSGFKIHTFRLFSLANRLSTSVENSLEALSIACRWDQIKCNYLSLNTLYSFILTQ